MSARLSGANDELMIDWGTVAPGSVATIYIPGLAASEIMLLAAHKYRSHRLGGLTPEASHSRN